MERRRTVLVHGDYSPKNILADGADLVILDFEVAHWGDPRFDIAFCISHLILKAQRRSAATSSLARAIAGFVSGYRSQGPAVLDRACSQIIGCLLLARLEGASPVEYLNDMDPPVVRSLAATMIRKPESTIETCVGHFWKSAQ
jgi:thiamine kinase-like enzyme